MSTDTGEPTNVAAEAFEQPFIHAIHDTRTDCFSVMTEMSVGRYLELVREAHANQGESRASVRCWEPPPHAAFASG